MNGLKGMLKREWELCALCGAVLFSVILAVIWLFAKPTVSWSFGRGAVSVERPVKLNGSAFAFLKQRDEKTSYQRNPFSSGLSVQERPAPVVIQKPVEVVAPVVEPEKVEEPQPVVQEEPLVEKKAETPAGPRKVVGEATYLFMNVNTSGKSVAVFSLKTSQEDSENYALGVGESGGGVKVLTITDEALGLQDANGKRWKVMKGKPSRMMVLKE